MVSVADQSFMALLLILGLNRIGLGVSGLGRFAPIHWGVQAINVASAVGLFTFGLPGMPANLRMLDWFIGLLLLMHVVENQVKRARLLQGQRHLNEIEQEKRLRESHSEYSAQASPTQVQDESTPTT